MAQPIPLEVRHGNARAELRSRVQQAPKNMRKRSWLRMKCSSSCTSEACSRSCAVAWRRSDGNSGKGSGHCENARRHSGDQKHAFFFRSDTWQHRARNGSKGVFQAIPDGIGTSDGGARSTGQLFRAASATRQQSSPRGLAAAVDFLQAFGHHLQVLNTYVRSGPEESKTASLDGEKKS